MAGSNTMDEVGDENTDSTVPPAAESKVEEEQPADENEEPENGSKAQEEDESKASEEGKGEEDENDWKDDFEHTKSIFINGLRYYVGLRLDVLDSCDRWDEAEIIELDPKDNRIHVTFLYWSDRHNTWLDMNSDERDRCAPYGTKTYQEGGVLQVGQRIEAQDFKGKWYEAFVVDAETDRVKVHFRRWAEKFDEWIERDGSRIRPYGRTKNIPRKGHRFICNVEQNVVAVHRRTIVESTDRFARYVTALRSRGLGVVKMIGDGNCLFRSVAHQVYGDQELHGLVRASCMDYMERERVFFSQFIDGSFDEYIRIKRRNGVWGDDPEIQAMCEIYNRPANIWSFDATHGARRLRTFHEGSVDPTPPIQLSYYGGGHYDSIISPTSFEGTIINAREAGQVEGLALERTLSGSGVAMRRATEGGEDEALRLALENSRRCFDAAIVNNDDLEHALNASLQDYESSAGLLGLCEQETKEGEATSSSSSSSSSVPTDMVQAQEAMLQQAVQRSEQEQLERAMQASLQGQEEDPEVLRQQAEEEELRRAIEASMQEEAVGGEGAEMIDEEEELRRAIEASMQEETSPPIASMTMIPDEDEELRRVLMLSQMSEEEMIRRAIEESQQVDSAPILGPGAMEEDEESLLQAAIEASMQEEERGEEEEERGEQQREEGEQGGQQEGEGQGEQQEGEEEG